MAKVQYSELMPEYSGILNVFSNKPEVLDEHNNHQATYNDTKSSSRIIIEGENFKYHGDQITHGTVDSVLFTDQDTDVLISATKLKVDVADLTKALTEKSLIAVLKQMFSGDDTWTGSTNNDYIFGDKGADKLVGGTGDDELDGGAGNDRLTGGKGSDYFYLYRGEGKDVVTDFHADGGMGVQDYIWVDNDHYKIKDAGEDTIIDFGKGDMLVLKHVDSADITTDDFYM